MSRSQEKVRVNRTDLVRRTTFVVSVIGLSAIMAFAVVTPMLPSGRATDHTISIGDNFFSPSSWTVQVGDTVIWTNEGNLVHTVTSTTPAGVLNSGNIAPDGTYAFTFNSVGTFNYQCIYHPMTGSITVVEVIPEFPSGAVVVAGLLAAVLGLLVVRRGR